jgi:hypothetical protein
MGDIHGAYKALKQCLKRSGFDFHKDMLIQLGDIVDRFLPFTGQLPSTYYWDRELWLAALEWQNTGSLQPNLPPFQNKNLIPGDIFRTYAHHTME